MRELASERRQHQRLAAQGMGREVRSPKIFAGHLRNDVVRVDEELLPLNPQQAEVLVTPFPAAYP